MDHSQLVSKHVLLPVLDLLDLSEVLDLLAGRLEEVIGGQVRAAEDKVHGGADLLQLDARDLGRGRLLQEDLVTAEKDGRAVLGGRELEGVFQPRQPDIGDFGATEEVDEQALESLELGLALELPGKHEAGLGPGGDLVVLELGQALVAGHAQLDHVQELVVVAAAEGQVVGTLLVAVPEDEEGGVELLGEELQLGVVLERKDLVLLLEEL